MTFVRIKGFKFYKDRHGKQRCYHRATGRAIDLEQCPIGTAQFIAACEKITAEMALKEPTQLGTLSSLIEQYQDHGDFTDLAPRTRKDYQRCFTYLAAIGDTPLDRFTTPLVIQIRDKAGKAMGRKWGSYVKTCLSIVFSWAIEHGQLSANPAHAIRNLKRAKDTPDTNPPWSDQNRERVLAALTPGMPITLPLYLMMFCGIDPGDVIRLPKTAISGGHLNTRRQKTKEPVWVPLPDMVQRALGVMPRHNAITLCATSRGKPWTKSGLDSAWQKLKAPLNIADKLTLKGLRHTVATMLAEMGYDERTIADMLGQKTIEMARHYSKSANKRDKMTAVIKSLNEELVKRRAKNGTKLG
jgi:integrase